jgi:sugar phosphate isomerase/epimerase
MIFVSTSCVKSQYIKEAIEELHAYGFKNIELSSGTGYYEELENDLLQLQAKYDLNYLCHNYFLPAKEPLVLNLASLNDEIYERSLQHLIHSVRVSRKLNATKFGFHAGFLIDLHVDEIGKRVSYKDNYMKAESFSRFCFAVNILQKESDGIKLYIENNVYSYENKKVYGDLRPFLLLDNEDYSEFKKQLNFNLLLDVAHLKISCNTLSLDFQKELDMLIAQTDYIHLSDNDALCDQNKIILPNSELFQMLSQYNLGGKSVTLEINAGLNKVKQSYDLISSLISR